MERMTSTDERLNLLAQTVDAGFARMDASFDRIDSRFERLEDRMDGQFARVDTDIRELRGVIFRFGGRLMVALVGVILALIGVGGAVLAAVLS